MAKATAALDYLKAPQKHSAQGVSVVFGDETFLKREVLTAIQRSVLGDADLALSVVTGKDTALRDVVDELDTVSMFSSGGRLVLVEQADEFVSRQRTELEAYVARPQHHGVLVLEVKSWPSNTRLFKAIAPRGLQVECKHLTGRQLPGWLKGRAKSHHKLTIEPAAVQLLLEMVEPELGLLDQELGRLALLAGPQGTLTAELVHSSVGSWRTKTAWDMIDAAAEGDAREALKQLDRLLLAGENPIALLGQFASTIRRFAAATQLVERAEREGRRVSLRPLLEQAGVKSFFLKKAEPQLRQIGRSRGRQLYRWLLDADLAIKGVSSSPPRARLVLEKLIVQLSRAADTRQRPAAAAGR